MKKKEYFNDLKRSVTFLCIFIALLLSGCGSTRDDSEPVVSEDEGNESPIQLITTESNEFSPNYETTNEEIETISQGVNEFAFKLSNVLLETHDNNENFVFSPYSVWIEMAAFANGLEETQREKLYQAISAGSHASSENVNQAAYRMNFDLSGKGDANIYGGDEFDTLEVLNTIFVSNQFTVQDGFIDTFDQYFNGSCMSVDFTAPDAADAANDWARNQSKGLFPEIITAFDQNDLIVLTNAVYFSDRWDSEFDEALTKKDRFQGPNGETQADFMVKTGEQLYFEDNDLQAVCLEFIKGGSLLIILPKAETAENILSSMNTESFFQIIRETQNAEGTLWLPRFTIDKELSLNKVLSALGVLQFDQNMNMQGMIAETVPVGISNISQKVSITVDEKGTTASAVTVLAAEAADEEPAENVPFEMYCDKPFIFILSSHTTDGGNQILFSGIVNQP